MLTDQLEHVEQVSSAGPGEADLALLTDGLRAEREQGITIDVAYRYFATPARKFILADCPGHVQYTRNMVTGSSTADVIVLLVDARNGVVEQTRRHPAVAALLRVPHVVLASTRSTWSTTPRSGSPRSPRISRMLARTSASPTSTASRSRPPGRQRGDPVAPDPGTTARPCWAPGDGRRHLSRPVSEFRFPVQHVVRPQQPLAPLGVADTA